MRAFIIALSCGVAGGLLSRWIWENLPPWGVLIIALMAGGTAWWGLTMVRSRPTKDSTAEVQQEIKAGGNVNAGPIKASGEEVKVSQKIKAKKDVTAGSIDIN